MGLICLQLTLPASGVARLSDAFLAQAGLPLSTPITDTEFVKRDVPLRWISFQALAAATTSFFIGDLPTVSSTIHGFRVDPADTAVPVVIAPGGESGPVKFSDFYVAGTAASVLLVAAVPY